MLKNSRLTLLIETILKVDQSTLQELSIILSGVILIHSYKSSHVLASARKLQQLLSLVSSSRKPILLGSRNLTSRALNLSLHFSAIASNRINLQNQLISSIFGAPAASDGHEVQHRSIVQSFAYNTPSYAAVSLLGEDTETDSLMLSRDSDFLLSGVNQDFQDVPGNTTIGETTLVDQLGDDMQVRAVEGDLVQHGSEIALQDLDASKSETDSAAQKLLQSRNPFDLSAVTFSEASRRLTSRLLTDMSDQVSQPTVIIKELKTSRRDRTATLSMTKKSKPPASLFDQQCRMSMATIRQHAYEPPKQYAIPFLISAADRLLFTYAEDGQHTGPSFNFSTPAHQALSAAILQSWKYRSTQNQPTDKIAPPDSPIHEGVSNWNMSPSPGLIEIDNHPAHNDQLTYAADLPLFSLVKKASSQLSITQLANSSKKTAASVFLMALELRANNMITITQRRTESFHYDVCLSILSA